MKISYSVEEFTNQEGGMGYSRWRSDIPTLEEAIIELRKAEAQPPYLNDSYANDWIITVQIDEG